MAHQLGFVSKDQWDKHCAAGSNKRHGLPPNPDKVHGKSFQGWPFWPGVGCTDEDVNIIKGALEQGAADDAQRLKENPPAKAAGKKPAAAACDEAAGFGGPCWDADKGRLSQKKAIRAMPSETLNTCGPKHGRETQAQADEVRRKHQRAHCALEDDGVHPTDEDDEPWRTHLFNNMDKWGIDRPDATENIARFNASLRGRTGAAKRARAPAPAKPQGRKKSKKIHTLYCMLGNRFDPDTKKRMCPVEWEEDKSTSWLDADAFTDKAAVEQHHREHPDPEGGWTLAVRVVRVRMVGETSKDTCTSFVSHDGRVAKLVNKTDEVVVSGNFSIKKDIVAMIDDNVGPVSVSLAMPLPTATTFDKTRAALMRAVTIDFTARTEARERKQHKKNKKNKRNVSPVEADEVTHAEALAARLLMAPQQHDVVQRHCIEKRNAKDRDVKARISACLADESDDMKRWAKRHEELGEAAHTIKAAMIEDPDDTDVDASTTLTWSVCDHCADFWNQHGRAFRSSDCCAGMSDGAACCSDTCAVCLQQMKPVGSVKSRPPQFASTTPTLHQARRRCKVQSTQNFVKPTLAPRTSRAHTPTASTSPPT